VSRSCGEEGRGNVSVTYDDRISTDPGVSSSMSGTGIRVPARATIVEHVGQGGDSDRLWVIVKRAVGGERGRRVLLDVLIVASFIVSSATTWHFEGAGLGRTPGKRAARAAGS